MNVKITKENLNENCFEAKERANSFVFCFNDLVVSAAWCATLKKLKKKKTPEKKIQFNC